ncbi:MAG: type II secretion system protein [Fimbriimonadaceae bacterium]
MRRGYTLASTLITVAIMGLLATAFMTGGFGMMSTKGESEDGKPQRSQTIPGRVRDRAQDTQCQQQLGQVRMGLQVAMVGVEEPPQTLEELRLGQSTITCPVSKEVYAYDPATGTVQCTFPDHTSY